MSVFCVLINSLLLIKCPVSKNSHFATLGKSKNIVILLTLDKPKNIAILLTLGKSKNGHFS